MSYKYIPNNVRILHKNNFHIYVSEKKKIFFFLQNNTKVSSSSFIYIISILYKISTYKLNMSFIHQEKQQKKFYVYKTLTQKFYYNTEAYTIINKFFIL